MDGRRTVGKKRKMTGTPVTVNKKQKMGSDNVFLAAPVSEAVDGTQDSGLPADGAVSEEVGDTQDPEVKKMQTPVQPTWGSSKTFLEAIVDEAMAKGEYNATLDSIWPKTRNLAEQGDGDEMEAYAEAVFQVAVTRWSKKSVIKVKLKLDAVRNGTYMELSMKKDVQLACAYTDWYSTVCLHRKLIPDSEYQALLASGFVKVFKRGKKYVPPFDERFRDYLQKKVPVPAQPSSSSTAPVSDPAQPAVASSSTAPPPPPPAPPHLQRPEGTKEKLVYDTVPAKADTLWVERMQTDGTVEFIKEMDAAEAQRLAEEKEARINGIWNEVGPKGKQKAETQSTKASSSHAPTGAVPPKAPTGAPSPASLGPIPLRGYNGVSAAKPTQQTEMQTQTQPQPQPVLRNKAWPRDPAGQVEASVPKLQQMLDLIQAAGLDITMGMHWRPFVMQIPINRSAWRCWAEQRLIVAANGLLPNKGIKFAWNSAYQLTFRSETRHIGVEETAYLAYLWKFVVIPYHEHLTSHGHKLLPEFVNIKLRQLGADHCRLATNVALVDIATAIQRRDARSAAVGATAYYWDSNPLLQQQHFPLPSRRRRAPPPRGFPHSGR
ncbi:hypothetical protein CcaCcLH18_05585 [Colletotrichum camelliae]|nr:hypothetical protein CcaCcLH18_05585 [Colletotrichum camelliae]